MQIAGRNIFSRQPHELADLDAADAFSSHRIILASKELTIIPGESRMVEFTCSSENSKPFFLRR